VRIRGIKPLLVFAETFDLGLEWEFVGQIIRVGGRPNASSQCSSVSASSVGVYILLSVKHVDPLPLVIAVSISPCVMANHLIFYEYLKNSN
jgi:hypothetical protein